MTIYRTYNKFRYYGHFQKLCGVNMENSKWYKKRSIRILAGALAFLLILTTIGYSIIRSRAESVYADLANSVDTFKAHSKEEFDSEDFNAVSSEVDTYNELRKSLDKGDYSNAAQNTKEIIASEGNEAVKEQFRELLAELNYNLGNYSESVNEADACINSGYEPSNEIYYVRGLSNIQLEKYDDALNDFKTIDNGSDNPELHKQMAIAAYSAQKYSDAAEFVEKYLGEVNSIGWLDDLVDENSKVDVLGDRNLCRYIAAISYMHDENYEKSVAHIDNILESGDDSELFFYRGINNMAMEKYADAASDFKKASELGKKDTDVFYNLGVCQISNGEIEEGIENLKIVIKENDKPELSTAASNIITAITQGG